MQSNGRQEAYLRKRMKKGAEVMEMEERRFKRNCGKKLWLFNALV